MASVQILSGYWECGQRENSDKYGKHLEMFPNSAFF